MVSFEDLLEGREKICVVGLGYVGLPLELHSCRPLLLSPQGFTGGVYPKAYIGW
ncbi:MAG: hypothetical protein ACK4VK_01990 [Aquificaceae bacterium]